MLLAQLAELLMELSLRCDKNDVDFSLRHAEKLRRASELRAQLQAEKTARLRELARRVR